MDLTCLPSSISAAIPPPFDAVNHAALELECVDAAESVLANAHVPIPSPQQKVETRGRKAKHRTQLPFAPEGVPCVMTATIRSAVASSKLGLDGKRIRSVLRTGLARSLSNVQSLSSPPAGFVASQHGRQVASAHTYAIHTSLCSGTDAVVYFISEPEVASLFCGSNSAVHSVVSCHYVQKKNKTQQLLSTDLSVFSDVDYSTLCLFAVFVGLANRLTSNGLPCLSLDASHLGALHSAIAFADGIVDTVLGLADVAKQRWSSKGLQTTAVPNAFGAQTERQLDSEDLFQDAAAIPVLRKRARTTSSEEPTTFAAVEDMSSRLSAEEHFSSLQHSAADIDSETLFQSATESAGYSSLFDLLHSADVIGGEAAPLQRHDDFVEKDVASPLCKEKPQYTIADVENLLLINIHSLQWSEREVYAQLQLLSLLYGCAPPDIALVDRGDPFKDAVHALMQFVRDIDMPYEVASSYVVCWEHASKGIRF